MWSFSQGCIVFTERISKEVSAAVDRANRKQLRSMICSMFFRESSGSRRWPVRLHPEPPSWDKYKRQGKYGLTETENKESSSCAWFHNKLKITTAQQKVSCFFFLFPNKTQIVTAYEVLTFNFLIVQTISTIIKWTALQSTQQAMTSTPSLFKRMQPPKYPTQSFETRGCRKSNFCQVLIKEKQVQLKKTTFPIHPHINACTVCGVPSAKIQLWAFQNEAVQTFTHTLLILCHKREN